ncbi:isoprenylcysteine carboxylmethyltransferase family protein [Microbacterium sp. ANT_H45B]|uniref:methyltransferase family protein n=1 Tax=Microbacterium sp. ANT_H45B TaxID=2597346 RepID=UPI0011EF4177|nr:isoprenylcysteine carboxylmethyltransferase family protein [Microbacterium sp. ANT_H45B]KAA0960863.1 isoprenylcysteine carboxylmethyltransferase family protein [Microbacterium sp. ANT_H45B]
MPVIAGIRITPITARVYFAVQALCGALWWVAVALSAEVRDATLGGLPAPVIAVFDIPLFVGGSALAAAGVRGALWVVTPWTALVALGMAVYATATTLAGWGALLMAIAAGASVAAAIVVLCGRAPVEWIVTGPFAFRPADRVGTRGLLARTGRQTLAFWGTFLIVVPLIAAVVEARWGLRIDAPPAVHIAGGVLLVVATALGVWSAVSMSVDGEGTPLPSQMARRLVITGPYRYVRNPMAVAGIAQGVAVGMLLGSWMVVAYSLVGSLLWNSLVRPLEEADLEQRFGAEFVAYRDRVTCWIPASPVSRQV